MDLGEKEWVFKSIFDTIQDGIIVLDKELNIVMANPWIEKICGGGKPIIGKKCYQVYQKKKSACPDCPALSTFATAKSNNKVIPCPLPEKKRKWLYISTYPLKGADGSVIGVVEHLKDYSEHKKMKAKLKRLSDEVQQCLDKVKEADAELSHYTYIVSHDIRAPLRAIRNYVDFLTEDLQGKLDHDQKEYLDGMIRAVKEAEELLEDLLRLSRTGRQDVAPEEIKTSVLMQDAVDSFNFPPEVEVKIDGDMPTVYVQTPLLREIFRELLDNAIKFNQSSPKRVEVGCREIEKDRYEFFIRDNGIGIDSKYHEKIFRIFERLHTKSEYEGTGIGLAIVKKAVGKLQGIIRIESTPGKGSTFFITIPNAKKELSK